MKNPLSLVACLLAFIAGCAGADGSPAAPALPPPCPSSAAVVETDAAAPTPAPDASTPAPIAPTHYDVYFTPGVSGDVENATLRAIDAWQSVTVGYVTFTAHNRSDVAKCTASAIYVEEVADLAGSDDDVAEHKFKSCHEIVVLYPWPDALAYQAEYARLGVAPLVPVIAHELGHVLGLPHASTLTHSVMIPFVSLATVTGPTCQDVDALGMLRGRPIACVEPR